MTRKEQIEEAAARFALGSTEKIKIVRISSFTCGAEWADENPDTNLWARFVVYKDSSMTSYMELQKEKDKLATALKRIEKLREALLLIRLTEEQKDMLPNIRKLVLQATDEDDEKSEAPT